MKKTIKLFLLLAIALFTLFNSNTYAVTGEKTNTIINTTLNFTPSQNNIYKSNDYVIDKYDINIVVNENNTFDITETITAYFNKSKHGIFRTIPLKNKVVRLDGTTSVNHAKVTNLSVDNEYTTSKENGN